MSAIVTVTPTNVATFQAVRWDGSGETLASVETLVVRHSGVVRRDSSIRRRGRTYSGLIVTSRNRRRYPVIDGEWIIALGNSGVFRVCSDKTYRKDYKEVEA